MIGEAFIKVRPDTDGFASGLTSSLGGAIRGVVGVLGGAFAVKKAFDFFGDSVAEATEANKVLAITQAALKSTGGAAGVTADQISGLAEKLSGLTGVDDEAIQGAENLLLTFTSIKNAAGKGNDIFNQTTKAALDLSTRFGGLDSSAIQLGKALQDPIKGVSALTRVGISFNEQQKKQIEQMVKSGDLMGAQKIILGEINREVGGSAEAAATPMAKLGVIIGNVKEQLGNALLPVVNRVASALSTALPKAIDFLTPILHGAQTVISAFISAFSGEGVTSDGIVGVAEQIGVTVREVFEEAKKDVGDFIAGFRGIGDEDSPFFKIGETARGLAETFTTVLLPAALEIASFVKDSLLPPFADLAGALLGNKDLVLGVVAAFVTFKTVAAVGSIIDTVKLAMLGLNAAFATTAAVAPAAASGTAAVGVASAGAAGPIGIAIAAGVGLGIVLHNLIEDHFPGINRALESFGGMVFDAGVKVSGFVGGALRSVGGALSAVGGAIFDFGAGWLRTFSGIGASIADFFALVSRIPGNIKNAIGNLGGLLLGAGKSLVQGLIDGVKSMAGTLGRAILNLIPGPVRSIVANALGISSPSTVFLGFGRNIMEGLILGLRDKQAAVAAEMGQLVGQFADFGPSLAFGNFGRPTSTTVPSTTTGSGGLGTAVITINEVANDPDATARAVAARLGLAVSRG